MAIERTAPRDGVPYETDVGTFVVYRITPASMATMRERAEAIAGARAMADGAGYRVLDVLQATYQDDGRWLVELRVEEKGCGGLA